MSDEKPHWVKVIEVTGVVAVSLAAIIGLISRLSFNQPSPPPPIPSPTATSTVSPSQPAPSATITLGGNPTVEVWVNTETGKYHCFGTKWFRKTIHGKSMTQKDAQEGGFQPAYGKVCM